MDWEILPLLGFGPLRFGMSSAQAASFDAIYGVVESRIDEAANDTGVLDAMSQFTAEIPEMRELMAQLASQHRGAFSEHRKTTSPILRFKDDKLYEIVLGEHCDRAEIGAIRPFVDPRREVIRGVTRLSGRRRKLRGVYLFEGLGIMMHGYSDGGERIVNLIDGVAAQAESEKFPLDQDDLE